jgi:hypothetical protein
MNASAVSKNSSLPSEGKLVEQEEEAVPVVQVTEALVCRGLASKYLDTSGTGIKGISGEFSVPRRPRKPGADVA